MKVDHLAGTVAAVGILLTFAFVAWTGLWGPVWQAAWEMKPSDALGVIVGVAGWIVTFGMGAWAYYGVRLQLAATQTQIANDREKTRINTLKAMSADVENLAADIDRLLMARGFLNKFEERFPPSSNLDGYTLRLIHTRNDALDFISQSAATAPFGYGEIVSTVMRRIQMLGDRIDQKTDGFMPQQGISNYYEPLVREAIIGIRSIVSQIDGQIPKRQDQLVRLMDARDQYL